MDPLLVCSLECSKKKKKKKKEKTKRKCNNRIFMVAFCTVCGTFIVWRMSHPVDMPGGGRKVGKLWFWAKVLLGPTDLTCPTCRCDFENATLAARTDHKTLTPTQNPPIPTQNHPPPMLEYLYVYQHRNKKRRKENKTQNGTHESLNMCFCFLCCFSTVTSCFFLAPPIYGLLHRLLIVSQL